MISGTVRKIALGAARVILMMDVDHVQHLLERQKR
uniref:Uncharacterized protein n=1 Tax=viral metagenome TaxID=1070528 RepID=A0A6C0J2Q9_9ZZZZ